MSKVFNVFKKLFYFVIFLFCKNKVLLVFEFMDNLMIVSNWLLDCYIDLIIGKLFNNWFN